MTDSDVFDWYLSDLFTFCVLFVSLTSYPDSVGTLIAVVPGRSSVQIWSRLLRDINTGK